MVDLRYGRLGLFHHKGIVNADHRLNVGRIGAVDNILFGQQKTAGDQNGADFMQRHGANPIFPAAAQNHQHGIAFLNPDRYKKVCGAV